MTVRQYGSAVALAALLTLSTGAVAEETLSPLSAEQRAQIESVVHDYLVSHPEVLIEAAQAMEEKRQAEAARTVARISSEILNDPRIPSRFGPAEGEVKHTIIEFFDYNCTYCKQARPLIEDFAGKHGVKVYYVEFPVLSALSAEASLIGMALFEDSPEKYFIYQDFLMARMEKLDNRATIEEAVEKAGGDFEALMEKAKGEALQNSVGSNIDRGRAIGVPGVPFFIVDGKPLRGGVTSLEVLEALLNK